MELNSKLDFFLFHSKISNNSSPQIKFIKNIFILNRFGSAFIHRWWINYDILPTLYTTHFKTHVPYRTSDVGTDLLTFSTWLKIWSLDQGIYTSILHQLSIGKFKFHLLMLNFCVRTLSWDHYHIDEIPYLPVLHKFL